MAKTEEQGRRLERSHPTSTSPTEEMERWLDDYHPRAWMRRWGWPSWGELTRPIERMAPRVDVIDRDEEVVVRAEVPGVDKNDLDVSVNEQTVTIKGSFRREDREEKGEFFRAEIARGEFSRTLNLPSAVDAEKSKATFRDGILELQMPKVSKSKRRRIEID